MGRKALFALALLSALAACSYENPNKGPDVTARGSTPQMQLATAAGLDVPRAASARTDAELGQATNAALAATNIINPLPGVSPAGAVGMGFIGFLTAPPAGQEASDQVIATGPIGGNKRDLEISFQKSVFALADRDLRARGYTPVDLPDEPGFITYIKPGCPLHRRGYYEKSCSQDFFPVFQPRGRASGQQVYMVSVAASDDMERFYPKPYYASYDPRVTRRVADANRGMIHLYFAPRRLDGAWTRAALYSNGRLVPL